jgi:hypothetical protein
VTLLRTPNRPTARKTCVTLGLLALCLPTACSDGDDGAPGAPGASGTPAPIPLGKTDPLPGFQLEILSVEGGTGPGGNLKVGDRPKITFTARTNAGEDIPSASWAFQELLFAGPSTSYQLILSTRDVAANSVKNSNGSWTLTMPFVIPSAVPNQMNQENTIPYDSGTLAGDQLPDGTYTFGMSMRQDVEIAGTTFRDATSATYDVLVGNATTIRRLELVKDDNCKTCHTTMRAHGSNRYGVAMCVMCHTNGSEDMNDPTAQAGETLGLSLSFQTMIHKIHSGSHLPSVNGKTVDANGDPVYGAAQPYTIVTHRGEDDFSHVTFPQWPHLAQGMPRDIGYDALTSAQKSAESAILSGPTNCAACHGDPDGTGPLTAPAHGDAIYTNAIVTRACIACHDDWDPSKPYTANGHTMPAGLGDETCTACHGETPTNPNSAVNVRKAHTHPLLDENDPPLWGAGAGARGLRFDITDVSDVPVVGVADGVIQAGEKIQLTLEVKDRNGAAVTGAEISRMEVVINGPTHNPNLIYMQTFSTNPSTSSVLGNGPQHKFLLPERIDLEVATAISPLVYQTAAAPHYPTQFGTWGATQVWTVDTGVPGGTTVAEKVKAYQNFVDVVDATGINAGVIVVIDEGTSVVEYIEVANVEGNRLWFAAPMTVNAVRIQKDHAIGAGVKVVQPVLDPTTVLDPNTGELTFAIAPTGNVLVSYTTDFVMPAAYRGAINNSPSQDPFDPRLDEVIGEWTGLPIEPGTYNIGAYGETGFAVDVVSGTTQSTSYTEGATGDTVAAFRVGTPGPLAANPRIEGASACNACHRDLQFHGSHRRGLDNCMLCHGTAGSEDWAQFRTSNMSSPETPGVSIEFREMIHKIHRGHELEAGADYVVAGYRGSPHSYEHVGFPSFLGGTANCTACHGENNTAWHEPTTRLHSQQSRLAPQLTWRMVCGSCHDGRTAFAHMISNSGGDVEGCAVCHGAGKENSVEVVHRHLVR